MTKPDRELVEVRVESSRLLSNEVHAIIIDSALEEIIVGEIEPGQTVVLPVMKTNGVENGELVVMFSCHLTN